MQKEMKLRKTQENDQLSEIFNTYIPAHLQLNDNKLEEKEKFQMTQCALGQPNFQ